ncbi:MAG: hypothetical protein HKN42_19710 [Granulosicoccus sp.]|nr:hypothetical protein [Granulosicoccus sp.]
MLFAFDDSGAHLRQWHLEADNRDWEDMATANIQGKEFLVVGDTGDNLGVHRHSTLYFVQEPDIDSPANRVLTPSFTIRFRYADGPRNVEAFAITGHTVYLVSKEPVTARGPTASRLYELELTPTAMASASDEILVATFAGELPMASPNLESRLAASFAGVDLNHPTALDFDPIGNTAYLLTYRHVLRVNRSGQQSWRDAFTAGGTRIHAHQLQQAEALAVVSGQWICITSEIAPAPLWALPIVPPS